MVLFERDLVDKVQRMLAGREALKTVSKHMLDLLRSRMYSMRPRKTVLEDSSSLMFLGYELE
jgi:hypothetical protein